MSDDSIKEIKDYYNNKASYLRADGELKYGVNNPIATLVLYSFSRGLLEEPI